MLDRCRRKAAEQGVDVVVHHQKMEALDLPRPYRPQNPEDLAVRVGAPYWETGRYERALALAQADGLVVRTAEGLLSAV